MLMLPEFHPELWGADVGSGRASNGFHDGWQSGLGCLLFGATFHREGKAGCWEYSHTDPQNVEIERALEAVAGNLPCYTPATNPWLSQ